MGKIQVAIVDDNERMVGLLQEILNEDSEIEVVGTANDGMKALELIKDKKPDVVLLDLIMPKLDGLGVMESIRNEKQNKKSAILYCNNSYWARRNHRKCFFARSKLLYNETI